VFVWPASGGASDGRTPLLDSRPAGAQARPRCEGGARADATLRSTMSSRPWSLWRPVVSSLRFDSSSSYFDFDFAFDNLFLLLSLSMSDGLFWYFVSFGGPQHHSFLMR
jgi:hypothetical protein